jgi:hypothetical protein
MGDNGIEDSVTLTIDRSLDSGCVPPSLFFLFIPHPTPTSYSLILLEYQFYAYLAPGATVYCIRDTYCLTCRDSPLLHPLVLLGFYNIGLLALLFRL